MPDYRFSREESCLGGPGESKLELEFLDLIRYGDHEGLDCLREDPTKTVAVARNAVFVRKCVKETVGTGNTELIK